MNGNITIVRVSSNDAGEYIKIEIREDGYSRPVLSLAMALEDFAIAITSARPAPCEIKRLSKPNVPAATAEVEA